MHAETLPTMKVKAPFCLADTHLAEGFGTSTIIVVEAQDVIERVIQASGTQCYREAFQRLYVFMKLSDPRLPPALQIASGIGDKLPKPCLDLKAQQSQIICQPVCYQNTEEGKAQAQPD